MTHETHDSHAPKNDNPTSSFRSSVWLIIILAGLFIAAVNFVSVMGHDEEGHGGGHEGYSTEATTHEAAAGHEATEHATEAEHTSTAPAVDSAHSEAH